MPFSPGGASDLIARASAEYLSKEWGSPVTVVNKPGGAGIVGSQAALKQGNPDGYTALGITVSMSSLLNAGMTNSPVKIEDNVFASRFAKDSIVFIVKDDAPWKDIKEFTDWAKKNPDQLTWTTTGPTGLATFAIGEWIQAIGGDFAKTRMITITGGADAVAKVAGGHAVLAALTIGESNALVKAGKVKVLAVQSAKRSTFLPDVPTFEEQGIKGLTTTWWAGVSLPVDTPEHVVKKWEESSAKMVKDPAFLDKLKNLNIEASYMNSTDSTKLTKEETAHFTDIATKIGIRK